MRSAFFDDPLYRKKQSEITKRYLKLHPRIKTFVTRICNNPDCQLPFQIKPADRKIYCSHGCAAHITNTLRKGKRLHPCRACEEPTKRSISIFCSLKCQQRESYSKYIERWKLGLEDGVIGISTKTISAHLRRYLAKKYGSKCSSCSWNQKNPVTNVVPLEVDHIDGNSENNKEENLRLICPNCHSLTPSFRNLNKGKGRSWRLLKIAQKQL